MLEYKEGVDLMSSTGNRYSNEFKQQIVELFQSGQTVSKLSREYGIPTGTIYKWTKELTPVITEDGKTVTPKEVKALEKRIRELEMENEILKKATAIFARKP
jgi:transposase